jgi:hypothetical protein
MDLCASAQDCQETYRKRNKTITEIIEDVVQSSLNRKKQFEARFSVS